MFSMRVGAQWVMSTGWPIEESVFHAVNIEEDEGGHERGGKESILPFGRLESAIEMPAMWYLSGLVLKLGKGGIDSLQGKQKKPVISLELLK
jgi:hypothetical protein